MYCQTLECQAVHLVLEHGLRQQCPGRCAGAQLACPCPGAAPCGGAVTCRPTPHCWARWLCPLTTCPAVRHPAQTEAGCPPHLQAAAPALWQGWQRVAPVPLPLHGCHGCDSSWCAALLQRLLPQPQPALALCLAAGWWGRCWQRHCPYCRLPPGMPVCAAVGPAGHPVVILHHQVSVTRQI